MKKNTKLEIVSDDYHSWSDTLVEHPVMQKIIDNGKTILYVILALILVVIIGYRLLSNNRSQSETDYANAQRDFILLTSSKEVTDTTAQAALLKNLGNAITSHPELHAKYDGILGQFLLAQGDQNQAIPYATAAIRRTANENDPFYTKYAQTTLLIANQKYEEALKAALALKEAMIAQGNELKSTPEKIQFGSLLYSLNLLRIGMLQQQLNLRAEESKTWSEWKALSQQSREGHLPPYLDGQLFLGFDRLLSEGEVSFANYIEAREKALNNALKN